jgi:hypothetical protein
VSPLAPILALLIGCPVGIFMFHAIAHRALDAAGRKPTAHASAFFAILGVYVVLLGTTWMLSVRAGGSLADVAGAMAYVSTVYAALAVLYLDVVNVAETSLHMHLLLELAWSGGIPLAELRERYSAERMIAARLERLSGIGQLRVADGRCYIVDKSALRFNACIDVWRIVLGLPTSPPEVGPAAVE